LEDNSFILATIHRAENTDNVDNLIALNKTFNELSGFYKIVLPLHPRTKKLSDSIGLVWDCAIIDPVGYFDMLELLKHCGLVITDSGGLQKEAYFFGKYCITIRQQTEWVELVKNGVNFIVGIDNKEIVEKTNEYFGLKAIYNPTMYGNGDAAKHIVDYIYNYSCL
jgi:UDP-GlcNAc3NAcA epimerase